MKIIIKNKEYEVSKKLVMTRSGNVYKSFTIKGARSNYYTIPFTDHEKNCLKTNHFFIVNGKCKVAELFRGVELMESENGELKVC